MVQQSVHGVVTQVEFFAELCNNVSWILVSINFDFFCVFSIEFHFQNTNWLWLLNFGNSWGCGWLLARYMRSTGWGLKVGSLRFLRLLLLLRLTQVSVWHPRLSLSSKLWLPWICDWLDEWFLTETFWLLTIYLSPDRSWSPVGSREISIIHGNGVWLELKLISLSLILNVSWISLLATIPLLKLFITSSA